MKGNPSRTIKFTIMPELLIMIYATIISLLFKVVCRIALTLFRIVLFVAQWTIQVLIHIIRFLYHHISRLTIWGWRKGVAHYRARQPRQMMS